MNRNFGGENDIDRLERALVQKRRVLKVRVEALEAESEAEKREE